MLPPPHVAVRKRVLKETPTPPRTGSLGEAWAGTELAEAGGLGAPRSSPWASHPRALPRVRAEDAPRTFFGLVFRRAEAELRLLNLGFRSLIL